MDYKLTFSIIAIILLLSLNIAVYLNGKSLNPDKCALTFRSYTPYESLTPQGYQQGMNEGRNFTVKLIDLYSNFKNGKCLVTFNQQEGYIYNP